MARYLAGLLVDGDIALRARGDLHGGGDHAVLAVGAESAFAAVIAVGDRAVTGEAVEEPERTEQGLAHRHSRRTPCPAAAW